MKINELKKEFEKNNFILKKGEIFFMDFEKYLIASGYNKNYKVWIMKNVEYNKDIEIEDTEEIESVEIESLKDKDIKYKIYSIEEIKRYR